jgi:hypothetical protein
MNTSTWFQIDRITVENIMLTSVEAAVAGDGYIVLGRLGKFFSTLTAEPIKLVVGCAAMGAVHLLLHMRLKDIGVGKGAGHHRTFPYALWTPLKLQSNWLQLLIVPTVRNDLRQPPRLLTAFFFLSPGAEINFAKNIRRQWPWYPVAPKTDFLEAKGLFGS